MFFLKTKYGSGSKARHPKFLVLQASRRAWFGRVKSTLFTFSVMEAQTFGSVEDGCYEEIVPMNTSSRLQYYFFLVVRDNNCLFVVDPAEYTSCKYCFISIKRHYLVFRALDPLVLRFYGKIAWVFI